MEEQNILYMGENTVHPLDGINKKLFIVSTKSTLSMLNTPENLSDFREQTPLEQELETIPGFHYIAEGDI